MVREGTDALAPPRLLPPNLSPAGPTQDPEEAGLGPVG